MAVSLLVLSACSKDTIQSECTGSMVDIQTFTGKYDSFVTRDAVTGSSFANGNEYGLFFCKHYDASGDGDNIYEAYSTGLNNVRAYKASNTEWRYYLKGRSTYLNGIYIIRNGDSNTMDCFAYAPYISSATSPEKIPFVLADQNDIMWATENSSPTSNKDISVDGTTKTVRLHFNHALCLLTLNFTLLDNTAATSLLTDLSIKRSDTATTPLYSNGTFNAITGEFVPTSLVSLEKGQAEKFAYKYDINDNKSNKISPGKKLTLLLMLLPTELITDGDIELVFYMDKHIMPLTYKIKRSDVLHSDGTTCGFKAGYNYTFNFVYDNYIRLTDVTINTDWTDATVRDITI